MAGSDNTMKLARATTAMMSAFDTALGATALLKPELLEELLGLEHDEGGRALLRRAGIVWLTYAAAHCIAYRRGRSGDWTALAWMRAMEVPADPIWAIYNKERLKPHGLATLIAFTPACNIAFTALFRAAARKMRAREASAE